MPKDAEIEMLHSVSRRGSEGGGGRAVGGQTKRRKKGEEHQGKHKEEGFAKKCWRRLQAARAGLQVGTGEKSKYMLQSVTKN